MSTSSPADLTMAAYVADFCQALALPGAVNLVVGERQRTEVEYARAHCITGRSLS